MRWMARIVPSCWRESVVRDLEDEVLAGGHGRWWLCWQVLTVGLQLRLAVNGDSMKTDLKYVLRSLWRAKAFTLAAALTLALGFGINLTVFSIVDRALFRPLPFADEERLIMITPEDPRTKQRYVAFRKGLFVAAREGVPAIEDRAYVSSFPASPFVIPGDGGPRLSLSEASFNVLDVLGTSVVVGRGFTRADAEARAPLALITHETWTSRFGGDTAVLGRQIGTGKNIRTIVGVLPRGFIKPVVQHSVRSDGLTLDDDLLEGGPLTANLSPAVARLAPGATITMARAQLTAVAEQMDAQLRGPGQDIGPRVAVDDLRSGMFAMSYRYLWLVTLAATLVGCLTAANLSGLLLARGRSRTQDVALRASLGATRARLLMTEVAQSLAICAVAGVAATVAVVWFSDRLLDLVPMYLKAYVVTGVDARVLAYTALVVLVSGVMAGLLPAWTASRRGLVEVLQMGAGGPAHTRAARLGRAVLVFEAAAGVVLVAGAAIALRSFLGLATADLGYSTQGLQEVRISPTGDRQGGEDGAELARYRGVLDALRERPGVVSAGGSDSTPGSGAAPMNGATWNGAVRAGLWRITEGWFETIKLSVVAGEPIRRVDVDEARPVAIVSETMARRLWPGVSNGDVLGRLLEAEGQPARRVVGVAADIRDNPLRAAEPRVYVPVTPEQFWFLELAVRAEPSVLDPAALVSQIGGRFGVTTFEVRPAGSSIAGALQQPRVQAVIFSSFAVVGLLVAAVGLFAVLSFDIALRRYELGVRAALGASASDIRLLVIRGALAPVLLGVSIGLAASYGVAGMIEALVFDVDVYDPGTLLLVALTLLATALVAAWIPARRAGRVDPATVLRSA